MAYKNKKGDLMLDSLLIILILVLFFLLATPINSVVNEVSVFTTDSNITWMLRGFSAFILIGIIRFIYSYSQGGVTE